MTTFGDRVYELGGTPVGIGSGDVPIFGKIWYVDGTNGSDDLPGLKPGEAKATIQAALTAQIAGTTSLGDVIYVFPGNYTETITGAMTKVSLIGISAGGQAGDAVVVQSATGHALSTAMTNASIRGIAFKTSSGGTYALAAVEVTLMVKSVIDNCKFLGTYDMGVSGLTTVGLQIGNTADTEWEFHEYSEITNNEFTTWGGRTLELDCGIRVGGVTVANPEYKGFKSMWIAGNRIFAQDYGIRMWTGNSSCAGTVIANNTISSHQGGNGPNLGIRSESTDGTDALCVIADNRILGISDGISNFSTCNTHGNIVSIGGGTPASETGQ